MLNFCIKQSVSFVIIYASSRRPAYALVRQNDVDIAQLSPDILMGRRIPNMLVLGEAMGTTE
jgi:hypothetical protein